MWSGSFFHSKKPIVTTASLTWLVREEENEDVVASAIISDNFFSDTKKS